MDQRFRPEERLHHSSEFTLAMDQGRRYSQSGLTLWVYHHPNVEGRKTRVGFAISKRYGNAVERNRIRRLLRETFRLNKYRLPPGVDLVFSAKPMGSKPDYHVIEPLVLKLWTKADLLTASPPTQRAS